MPTVADVKLLNDALLDLGFGEILAHKALTVVPLLGGPRPGPDWLTLADAGDKVTITEVTEAGSVPVLGVKNDADRPVLLLDGEELVGAKQNRVLNTTVLVAAHATLRIPVSCVEQGRWNYRGHRFAASEYSLYALLRAKKAARVSESLKRGAGHVSDQGEIWAGVADRSRRLNIESPTGAMRDVYTRLEDDLAAARQALACRGDQVGALVLLAGEWVGLDLLPSPSLFSRAWPRLCAGYAADALAAAPGRAPKSTPAEVLSRLAAAPVEPAPAVGLGEELRLGGPVAGAALVADGVVAHLMAFPAVMN